MLLARFIKVILLVLFSLDTQGLTKLNWLVNIIEGAQTHRKNRGRSFQRKFFGEALIRGGRSFEEIRYWWNDDYM